MILVTKYFLDKRWKEFEEYFNSKNISPTIRKKFLSSFNSYIKENKDSFVDFWELIQKYKSSLIEVTLKEINLVYSQNKLLQFVSDWGYSYLGPGEILLILLMEESYSGGKRYPDILFRNSDRKIEVKSYGKNFRLTESTYFFTDLGTIIQALVQGGFLSSLTDINNNDLRKGLRYFGESFLAKRGYIELNNKIWKLEHKTEDQMVFKLSPKTPREMVQYSIVRNSIRNWLGRGILSIKLAEIIDPSRSNKISRSEINDYINNLLGVNDLAPIPLEQYFGLCGLESIILYEPENKKEPFQIIKYKDLKKFTIDRIGQSKVSYKKKLLKPSNNS